MREYNTALISKARDGKSSTKSGTSSETDTAIAAKSVESAGSTGLIAKPAESESESESESECIIARDEAYGRPKWTDASRLSGVRR